MLSDMKHTLIALTRRLLAALTTRPRATVYAYAYTNLRKRRHPRAR
jgi:hypothetical protein